jgi:hypothetical protein
LELVAAIVPMPHKMFDPACEIGATEHQFFFRDSLVNYAQAKVLSAKSKSVIGHFLLVQGSVSEELLVRIQKGCIDSMHAYNNHKIMVKRLVPGI